MVFALAFGLAGLALGGSSIAFATVTWGAIAGMVGSFIGGLIDQAVFATHTHEDGPRLSDLSVQSSAYGMPIPLLYGPQNRVSGNIIWSTGLKETAYTTTVGGKGKSSSSVTQYAYSTSLAVMVAGRQLSRIKRIWGDGKLVFDFESAKIPIVIAGDGSYVATSENGQFEATTMRFYMGTDTQGIDPDMEAALGVGNCPRYIFLAYVVMADLQLGDFGNRVPTFSFECEADPTITVGEVVEDICSRAGISTVGTEQLTDNLLGFAISNDSSSKSYLDVLSAAFFFDGAEQYGAIRFVKRGIHIDGTIILDDLGSYEYGGSPVDKLPITVGDVTLLPSSLTTTYVDPARDYQSGTARAIKSDEVQSKIKASTQVAVTMAGDDAAKMAQVMLYEQWIARNATKMTLTDRYHNVQAGYWIYVPIGTELTLWKIAERNFGANNILELKAVAADQDIYLSIAKGNSGNFPPNIFEDPGNTRALFLDTVLLRDIDNNPGFDFAVTGNEPGWRGARLFRSTDNVDFKSALTVNLKTVLGDLQKVSNHPNYPIDPVYPTIYSGHAILASPPNTSAVLDTVTTFIVTLCATTDTLESITEDQLNNWGNLAVVGQEVIQFMTATLMTYLPTWAPGANIDAGTCCSTVASPSGTQLRCIQAGVTSGAEPTWPTVYGATVTDGTVTWVVEHLTLTYQLSNLVRGVKGSGPFMATHQAGESFCLLDTTTMSRINFGLSDVNAPRWYKVPSFNEVIDNVPEVEFINTAVSLKPLAPYHGRATIDPVSNDFAVTWERNSRIGTGMIDNSDVPLGEIYEKYSVDILSGSAVINTFSVLTPALLYTGAQQILDFGSTQSTILMNIYEISDSIGRGFFYSVRLS